MILSVPGRDEGNILEYSHGNGIFDIRKEFPCSRESVSGIDPCP
jgi:hypothetical protein